MIRFFDAGIFCCVTLTVLVKGCAYHEMLKRLEAQQQQTTNQFLRRFRLQQISKTSSNPEVTSIPIVRAGDATRYKNVPVHRNPNPGIQRYTAYNSRRGYYVPSSIGESPRRVYIGSVNTRYYPSNRCPYSAYKMCPVGTRCVFDSNSGLYRCQFQSNRRTYQCGPGYEKAIIFSSHFQCLDINECRNETLNTCEHECFNTPGSYFCSCFSGYQKTLQGSCQDKNECLGYHRCNYECVNAVGSYSCTCPEGYALQIDRRKCRDVNECEIDVCSNDEECFNTYGGYECLTKIECEEGYHRENVSTGSKSSLCIADRNTRANPRVISEARYALTRNIPANFVVGRLSSATPIYKFKVIQGAENFRVVRTSPYFIFIRTTRTLSEPGWLNLKILLYNNPNFHDQRNLTTNRVDYTFHVSEYGF